MFLEIYHTSKMSTLNSEDKYFQALSLPYLRERSHILSQPAAVATVRNDPQSCMPIGRPSMSLVGSICFIVPWNVRTWTALPSSSRISRLWSCIRADSTSQENEPIQIFINLLQKLLHFLWVLGRNHIKLFHHFVVGKVKFRKVDSI